MTQPSEHATGSRPRIVRHSVNEEGVRKRIRYFDEDRSDAVAAARRSLIRCNSLKIEALEHAAQVLVLNPESPDACRSLRLGAEAVVAIFEGVMAKSEEIEVRLGEGPSVRVPSAVTPDLHDVGNWTDGYFMAAICRHRDFLDSLCRVPIEILRSSTTRGAEAVYLFAEGLQRYWRGEESPEEAAKAALRAAEDRSLPTPSRTATDKLDIPEIQLFLSLVGRDAAPLNERLARALELHREYWSRIEEARDPRGYVSLSLTGLAALAHDAGIPITVESDYLPMGLVRGDCRGSV